MANEEKQVTKQEPTYSQRFTSMVVKEFSREVGKLEMTPYQERLAQHLFIGVDMALKKLESDRLKKNESKLPVVWANVNMEKLAVDAVHRVELGLDALIPNHIHTIPYLNGKTGKYDLDLQIGYVGKDYYKQKMALNTPKEIIYQLVYETDTFEPVMKTRGNEIESYNFQITNPFDRGAVIGGFGYIIYDDTTLNKLVIVPKSSFDKSQKLAKSDRFWNPYTEQMQLVVLVRRVTAALKIDPEKTNASFMKVEIDDALTGAERDIDDNANGEIIDIEPGPDPGPSPKPTQEGVLSLKEAWRQEWVNLKTGGYVEYVSKNFRKIEENTKAWPDLLQEMKVKWTKLSTNPWPLVEQVKETTASPPDLEAKEKVIESTEEIKDDLLCHSESINKGPSGMVKASYCENACQFSVDCSDFALYQENIKTGSEGPSF